MKIDKQFAPITITFESELEYRQFVEMIRRASFQNTFRGYCTDRRDDIEERALHLYKQLK